MKLKIRQYGNGGQTLVILHGLLGSSKNWHGTGAALGTHFNVIVPDLRNHGESPHAEHSIEAMREDLEEFFDELQLDKPFLLGHSMGGLSAMSFAVTNETRIRGLIVVDISPQVDLTRMAWIFEALQRVDLNKITNRQEANRQLSAAITADSVRQFLLQNLQRQENGAHRWRCNLPALFEFITANEPFKLPPLSRYSGPTLFIGGEQSEHKIANKVEVIAQHFPNYQLVMFPNTGHWVHYEAMNAFVKRVVCFIRENS
ncbi:MAG: alpha/beta fold hydrolase [bacterium]